MAVAEGPVEVAPTLSQKPPASVSRVDSQGRRDEEASEKLMVRKGRWVPGFSVSNYFENTWSKKKKKRGKH